MIGPENSHHSLNQSDEKLPPITIWWLAFSRALGSLAVFTSSSHVLLKVFYVVVIGLVLVFTAPLKSALFQYLNYVAC